MLLFKNRAETMQGVLDYQMHASDKQPSNAKKGEIILIAQTKDTLKNNEKPIRYVMNYDRSEKDYKGLSENIWDKKWNYLIRGCNLRPIKPFDINDLKVSDKNYDSVMTFCKVKEEDKEIILDWIRKN